MSENQFGHDPFREKLMEKISAIHTDVAVIKSQVEGLTVDSERSRENHILHFRAAELIREDVRTAQHAAEVAANEIRSHKDSHWKWVTLRAAIPASLLALWVLIKKIALGD